MPYFDTIEERPTFGGHPRTVIYKYFQSQKEQDRFSERVRKLDCKENQECINAKNAFFCDPGYVHEDVLRVLYDNGL